MTKATVKGNDHRNTLIPPALRNPLAHRLRLLIILMWPILSQCNFAPKAEEHVTDIEPVYCEPTSSDFGPQQGSMNYRPQNESGLPQCERIFLGSPNEDDSQPNTVTINAQLVNAETLIRERACWNNLPVEPIDANANGSQQIADYLESLSGPDWARIVSGALENETCALNVISQNLTSYNEIEFNTRQFLMLRTQFSDLPSIRFRSSTGMHNIYAIPIALTNRQNNHRHLECAVLDSPRTITLSQVLIRRSIDQCRMHFEALFSLRGSL